MVKGITHQSLARWWENCLTLVYSGDILKMEGILIFFRETGDDGIAQRNFACDFQLI